jgi:MOSC domain-containing protein YiiM
MATTPGKVLSVNVGTVREFAYGGRPAKSAIWKSPADGRIAARGVNLAGDDQADRKAHGGPDKAVYAYAVEDARWWKQEIGRSLAYGEFGENLTTEGIEVNDALVGERWEIGTVVLEVCEPRIPCWRLGVRMNDKMFPWKRPPARSIREEKPYVHFLSFSPESRDVENGFSGTVFGFAGT